MALPRTSAVRPRRSALYVPASNPRAVEKARGLESDVIILDLEDSVAPDQKAAARARAVAAAGLFAPREVVVRVNHPSTAFGGADLDAVAHSSADAVLVPKVETAEEVRKVHASLSSSGARDDLALWCLIETPRGVLAADAIAGACPRMAALVAGTSDLAAALFAHHVKGREPLLFALSAIVLAARANGLFVLDGVHLDLDDEPGFEAVCRQGRDLGFDGKTLIHPRTIKAANRLFTPDLEEVEHARRVLEAFEEALLRGKGVAVVDGRLVEALHAEEARRLVSLVEAISARRMG